MGRVRNTNLPSASSFNGAFTPDEDMVVKGKGIDALRVQTGNFSRDTALRIITLHIILPRARLLSPCVSLPRDIVHGPVIILRSPYILTQARLVSLPFPSSFATDGGMKTPGLRQILSTMRLKRGRFNRPYILPNSSP